MIHVDHLPIDDDGPFRVTALGTPTPQGPATIYVAVDVEDVGEFLGTLARKGAVGLTVLLGVFACTLWLVVGRTIGSVEAIRRRAELITGRRLNQRVPEPTTHDEIFRLARTLNDMLGRLEESAKRQERFVADAAHELRTPLTTLRTQLETAMMRSDPDPDPRLLPELWSEAVRMGSLVDQLLLLARSDAGTLPFLDHPVDLDDVLRDVLTSTPTGAISVRARRVEPVQVRGNAALLEQVVRNLVENAVRHAAGAVDLSLTSDGSTAVVTVDDDGPGIAPEDRAEVFHRFVRLDDSRDRSRGGVGLGLAIVAEIVRMHSGSVEVTESPAGGARFTVRFRAGRRRAEDDTSPRRVAHALSTGHPRVRCGGEPLTLAALGTRRPRGRLARRRRAGSAVDVAADEGLDLGAAEVVGHLHGWGLHQVGGGGQDGAADAAVEGDLGGADGVDDDAGAVGGVPDLELVLEVEGDVAEGAALEADVGPFAVVEPGDVVGGADVDVAGAEVVGRCWR